MEKQGGGVVIRERQKSERKSARESGDKLSGERREREKVRERR